MTNIPSTAGPGLVPNLLARVLRAPSGWTLEAFCRLDRAAPGILRFAASSRPEWRHAVAVSVANGLFDHADRFHDAATGDRFDGSWPDLLAGTAALLMLMKPKAIIEASLGTCPEGFVGALRKLGFEPLSLDGMNELRVIFTDPSLAHRRKTIMQLPRLDPDLFDAVCRLDPALVSPGVVRQAATGSGADRINRQIAAIRRHCSTATDEALASSLGEAEGSTDAWARSWLSRADQNFPAPPWGGDQGLIPLVTGALLTKAAQRTRTCIRTRIHYILEGRACYFFDAEAGAIACVIRTTSGWLATQVVGTGNGPLPPGVEDRVFDTLEANGISCFRPIPRRSSLGLALHQPWGMGEFNLDDDLDRDLD